VSPSLAGEETRVKGEVRVCNSGSRREYETLREVHLDCGMQSHKAE